MKISVNAASAGSGKTWQSKQLIRLKDKDKFLVVVPSIKLANEYSDVGYVIHSETTDNVSSEVFMNLDKRVIIITHQAFLRNKSKQTVCRNRHIIQDEEMGVMDQVEMRLKIHLPWIDMFNYAPWGRWFILSPNTAKLAVYYDDADTMDNIEVINSMLHTPQVMYIESDDFEMAQTAYRYISPDIYAEAKSITINSANFKNLMQYHIWKNIFEVEFEFTKEFVKYEAPNLQFHHAEQRYNSINYNKENGDIRGQVIHYCQQLAKDKQVVYVDNNNMKNITARNFERIKHNAHGLNEFSETEHIAFLSAINYNNTRIKDITEQVGITSDQLRHANLGEMAHQIIMRGSLRNSRTSLRERECHVYLMEQELCFYLMSEVFNCPMSITIPNTTRSQTLEVITAADSQKACAIKNAYPEKYRGVKKYSVHELMKMNIWNFTSARGKILAHYKDFWDEQPDEKWYV